MKTKFQYISTFLIVILTGILVGILVRYFNTPIEVNTSFMDVNSSGDNESTNHDSPTIISVNNSGNVITNTNHETIINDSGEMNTKIEQHDHDIVDSTNSEMVSPNSVEKETEKEEEKPGSVIITSEDTMTNKEKREILTELDNTLMELLDVVDKVQTVDETRLITDESGVQP